MRKSTGLFARTGIRVTFIALALCHGANAQTQIARYSPAEVSTQLYRAIWQDSLQPFDPELLGIFTSDEDAENQLPSGVLGLDWGQPRSEFALLHAAPFAVQTIIDRDGISASALNLAEYHAEAMTIDSKGSVQHPRVMSFMFCSRTIAGDPLQFPLDSMEFCGVRLQFRNEYGPQLVALGDKPTTFERYLHALREFFGDPKDFSTAVHNFNSAVSAARRHIRPTWLWCEGRRRWGGPSCNPLGIALSVNPETHLGTALFATPALYDYAAKLRASVANDDALNPSLFGSSYTPPSCARGCSYWYRYSGCLARGPADLNLADTLFVVLVNENDYPLGHATVADPPSPCPGIARPN